MILAGGTKSVSLPRRPDLHTNAARVFNHNIRYIAALTALKNWYAHVRPIFAKDDLSKKLIIGLQNNLAGCIHERIRQLEKFCDTLRASRAHDRILTKMESARKQFDTDVGQNCLTSQGQTFVTRMTALAAENKEDYISVIQNLDDKTKSLGSGWLHGIETSLSGPLQI
jgi:hypothetical protein